MEEDDDAAEKEEVDEENEVKEEEEEDEAADGDSIAGENDDEVGRGAEVRGGTDKVFLFALLEVTSRLDVPSAAPSAADKGKDDASA